MKVVNIVVIESLPDKIDLRLAAQKIDSFCSWNEACPGQLVVKSESLKGTITIWSSGRIVSLGTNSLSNAKKDIKLILRQLHSR